MDCEEVSANRRRIPIPIAPPSLLESASGDDSRDHGITGREDQKEYRNWGIVMDMNGFHDITGVLGNYGHVPGCSRRR